MDLPQASRCNPTHLQVQHAHAAGPPQSPSILANARNQYHNIETSQVVPYPRAIHGELRDHALTASSISSHVHQQHASFQMQQASIHQRATVMPPPAHPGPFTNSSVNFRGPGPGVTPLNTMQEIAPDARSHSLVSVAANNPSAQSRTDFMELIASHRQIGTVPDGTGQVQKHGGVLNAANYPSESRINPGILEQRTQAPSAALSRPTQVSLESQNAIHGQSDLRAPNAIPAHTGTQTSVNSGSSSTLVETILQSADRHASSILARGNPLLVEFLKGQQKNLRNELVRLNSWYQNSISEVKEELHKARQAEQEARNKEHTAVRETEKIIQQAMEWKRSLEDTRKKYKNLQDQYTKLALLALRQNEILTANSSPANVAGLEDRISVLETRLRKYEDVPSANVAGSRSTISNNLSEHSPTPNTLVAQNMAFSHGELPCESNRQSETGKLRLQNEVSIVAELVERASKPDAAKLSSHGGVKAEPVTLDGENTLFNVPYVIDLTDDSELPTTISMSTNDDESTGSHALQESSVASGTSADTAKRKQSFEGGQERKQKRARSGDFDILQASSESTGLQEEGPAFHQEAAFQSEPNNVGRNAAFIATHGEGYLLSDSYGSGVQMKTVAEVPSIAAPVGQKLAIKDEEPSPQLDLVHLQLIYYKDVSGSHECRFCLMDISSGVRDPNSGTVFSANEGDDILIRHAFSDHYSAVSSLLELDRTELLTAFAKLMEAD